MAFSLPVRGVGGGIAAGAVIAIVGGADIVRVHDVKQMSRVARVADAIVRGWKEDK